MVEQRSLKKNFIYNLVSQILSIIIPIITTPYISRVLQVDVIGQISYSASIVSYFVIAANLGFNIYGQRAIAAVRENKEEKAKIFWGIMLAKAALAVVSLAVLYSILFSVGFGQNYNKFILILSLQVVAVIFDIQFFYQGEEDFKSLAIRTILIRVLVLALIFVLVKDREDGWIYVLMTSVINLLANIVMWPKIFKQIKIKSISIRDILSHLKPAFLTFLPMLAVTIYSIFDKTMIGLLAQDPDYANGCYDRAYIINSTALVLITVLTAIMAPRNAHEYATGNVEAVKGHLAFSSRYIWMMGTPMIVGFAVLSKSLTISYLGPGYDEVPILMQIMSVRFIVAGIGDMLGSQLFIAIGKEKYPTIATSIGAVVNVVSNFLLIPKYGATGAAIATAICEVVVAAIVIGLAVKKSFFNIKEMLFKSWKYVVSAAIMFVPIYFLEKVFEYNFLTFLLITLVGVMVYFICLFILRDGFLIENVKNIINSLKARLKKETMSKEENNEN